jgi:hypothetical protein
MITADSLEWTSEDIAIWRQFLQTRTGSRLLPKVAEAAPALLPHGDTNAILIRSGELRGVQEAIRTMLALTQEEPAPEKEVTAYPALDDDSAWNDKQKIDTQPEQNP